MAKRVIRKHDYEESEWLPEVKLSAQHRLTNDLNFKY